MTKEEAKEILSGYVKACKEDDFLTLEMFEYEKVIEAMAMGAKALSIPSLPANFDEAAEKYAKENCENYVDEEDGVTYIEEALRNTFKAGAEWMAGQVEQVGVKESPSKTFPRVNVFETGASYRH